MSISDDKFYAQKDANFRQRVYNILYNDSAPHSEQEALELINNLCKGLPPKVIDSDEPVIINLPEGTNLKKRSMQYDYAEKVTNSDDDYAECVDNLTNNMKES